LPLSRLRRREKIFGDAPAWPLDRNAKARVWAAAGAYNAQWRHRGQHQGPLTWATLRVLRALLWRFHSADGGGKCFPSYERIAVAAKCARSSVAVAIKALEDAGVLTWVNRITRIRRRERDLFGHIISVWQVIRTSNGYRFLDPLDRRKSYKSENPTGPQNRDKKIDGARLDGARVMQEELPGTALVPLDRSAIARQHEHGIAAGAQLSPAEYAALIARLDTKPTKDDWVRYNAWLESRIAF
jgi:hypothetical protein